jgi:Kef-type K+ transport system membrane component KefB
VLGLLCALGLNLAGLASQPLFLAIVLISTSAGLLLPLLKDAREENTPFGQLVMTAAALAEVVPILLLSLLFSAASKTSAQRITSLAIFLLLLAVVGLALGPGCAGWRAWNGINGPPGKPGPPSPGWPVIPSADQHAAKTTPAALTARPRADHGR